MHTKGCCPNSTDIEIKSEQHQRKSWGEGAKQKRNNKKEVW